MIRDNRIFLGMADGERVEFDLKMTNRHGLIAGATGTGKTVSLKVLAESFSDAGVPVFMADVKGDLAGMYEAGTEKDSVKARVEEFGLAEQGFEFKKYPVNFWDVYSKGGLPLRTTVSEMGPLLMSRILGLTDTQAAVLTVLFKIADDNELLLIDTKDLKAMLAYVEEHAADFAMEYGNMTKQSLAVIVRAVVALESEGGDQFFGEPALDINDWLATDSDGKGMIQILDARELVNKPAMYSTFLLWMISELYETLPEVGDLDKPKMVFFFDEAHLLFDTASKSLLEKIEQIVKLIRSKGVGIFFVTQSPRDVPDSVLAQLGNKVQHALHAYTPAEIKAVKQAADSFRANPAFDTYDTLVSLGIGEALVSTLEADGVPTVVQKTTMLPPQSSMGAIEDSVRAKAIASSELFNRYTDFFDRDSAYEFLTRKNTEAQAEAERLRKEADEKKQAEIEAKEAEKKAAEETKNAEKEAKEAARQAEKEAKEAARQAEKEAKEAEKQALAAQKAAEKEAAAKKRKVTSVISSTAGSAGGTVGREVGNALGNAIGGKFGKKIGGNIGATLGRGILKTLFSWKN